MSSQSARTRAKRLREARAARGWPYCEHCGSLRITGTAAELVVAARSALPRQQADFLVDGLASMAADTSAQQLLGFCPGCACIAVEGIPHRL